MVESKHFDDFLCITLASGVQSVWWEREVTSEHRHVSDCDEKYFLKYFQIVSNDHRLILRKKRRAVNNVQFKFSIDWIRPVIISEKKEHEMGALQMVEKKTMKCNSKTTANIHLPLYPGIRKAMIQ